MNKTVLNNCTLLDGTAQMQPQPGMTIVLDGQNIETVSSVCPELSEKNDFHLMGHYVLPGLINLKSCLASSPVRRLGGSGLRCARTRLKCSGAARATMMSGVTTAATFDNGGAEALVRDWINIANVDGPRILSGGVSILPPGAGGDLFAPASPEQARACIDQLSSLQPAFVRVIAAREGARMPADVLQACCQAAQALGARVIVYADETDSVRAALRCGAAAVEHGARMDDETAALYHETGAALLVSLSGLVAQKAKTAAALDIAVACAKDAVSRGIPVGLGSGAGESGCAHYDMWREIYWFSKLTGVSCAQALHAATAVNASIAGLASQAGQIAPGLCADLFVTDRNPLEDLAALREPTLLFVRGVVTTPRQSKNRQSEIKLDKLL